MTYARDERRPPAPRRLQREIHDRSDQVAHDNAELEERGQAAPIAEAHEILDGATPTAREAALAFALLERVHREAILDDDLAAEIGALLTRKLV